MSSNGFIGKDAIQQAGRRRYTSKEVEGLGTIRIQSLTEYERRQYEATISRALDKNDRLTADGHYDVRTLLVAMCLVDGDGNRLFTNDQLAALRELDSQMIDRMFDACDEHCKGTDATQEELAKNLERTPAERSPTA